MGLAMGRDFGIKRRWDSHLLFVVLTVYSKYLIIFSVSKISYNDIKGREMMDISEKTEEIVKNIRTINRIIHMKRHEIAQSNNLTLDQFHTLIYLNNIDNPPTIGKMAAETNKAQNTISERISRLEEKGLVERVKDKNDRRVSRVVLTQVGAELINSINYQASTEFVKKTLINIEAQVVDNMLYGLGELAKRLDKE